MDDAVKSLTDFSETYQAAVDQPQPLFRRRAAAAPGEPLTAKIDALRARLKDILEHHAPATFASSFGAEDMVLIDLIAREFPSIEIFTLDTGRLPQATLDLMREAVSRYQFDLKTHRPDPAAVTIYVNTRGLNGFYDSLENRKACCAIRKVEPLKRALAGKAAWITGLRREQAVSRQNVAEVEHDDSHGLTKFNPLIDWTNEDVWAYIRQHHVPYNKLHDKGYPSIGCEPCTRAIKPGEDPRAGRWWWEGKAGQQECGLHVAEEGGASRFTPINVSVIERTDA
ncbi:MAG: phosphoadenylyl-sulfate reductase [Betaproteobacteria bacterium]|nr:phosphoadenylyl-sulfate reductase [Betaproteobacteria bacterium]